MMSNSTNSSECVPGNEEASDFIIEVHDHDVKGGKGHGTNRHPGNQFYLEKIYERKDFYLTLKSNKEKAALARDIIQMVEDRKPPGRFIKENRATCKWEIVPRKKVERKVKQALRDMAKYPCTDGEIRSDTELSLSGSEGSRFAPLAQESLLGVDEETAYHCSSHEPDNDRKRARYNTEELSPTLCSHSFESPTYSNHADHETRQKRCHENEMGIAAESDFTDNTPMMSSRQQSRNHDNARGLTDSVKISPFSDNEIRQIISNLNQDGQNDDSSRLFESV